MRRFVFRVNFYIDHPPEAAWPILSDTNFLNEMTGEARYVAEDVLQPDGSVRRLAKGRFGPMAAEWEEGLGEWIENRWARQQRVYSKGMVRQLDFECHITPEGQGCRIEFDVVIKSDGLVAAIGQRFGMMESALRRRVESMVKAASLLADKSAIAPGDWHETLSELGTSSELPSVAASRLRGLIADLAASSYDHGLADRLSSFLSTAPEARLQKIRPLALARAWDASPRTVVELCLKARELGILQMSWDVLCPRCRGTKNPIEDLGELPNAVHCSTCNIDFSQDFSQNVELTFRPAAWLRELGSGEFCMMGAQSTPHIIVQRNIDPGDNVDLELTLPAGAYRIRTAEAGSSFGFDSNGRDSSVPAAIAHGADDIAAGEPAPPGHVRFENKSDRRLAFVIEDQAWRDDALTGDQAITMAAFRALLPHQVVRPGEEVNVGEVTLLFTDLKGSTSLYADIGDALAYRLVRDHFDFLRAAISDHHGSVVKTIGDAVMAAFGEPADAIDAALAMQSGVADFNDGRDDGGIVLKLGLHQGACIGVNTDGTLDYFGNMVNITARLEGQSHGGDIVLSRSLADDPEVAKRLVDRPQSTEHVTLRGVKEPVAVVRMLPEQ
jgi:class 3 adenylate cyclase